MYMVCTGRARSAKVLGKSLPGAVFSHANEASGVLSSQGGGRTKSLIAWSSVVMLRRLLPAMLFGGRRKNACETPGH